MARYIEEAIIPVAGGRHLLPKDSKILGVVKLASNFVLLTEVWGDPLDVVEIDIKVFHSREYILPESTYIGYCVVGNRVYHFSYISPRVLDEGGDGGKAPVEFKAETVSAIKTVKHAGGMKEH